MNKVWMEVECPYCQAAVGEVCRAKRMKRRVDIHRSRMDAVWEHYYEEGFGPLYQRGRVSVENGEVVGKLLLAECDLGVQVSQDGRLWLCVNGVAWIRFKPVVVA